MKLQLLEFLYNHSKFEEGLKEIELNLKRNSSINIFDNPQIYIWKLKFLSKLEHYSRGINLAKKMLQEEKITKFPIFEVDILIERIKIFFSMGKTQNIIKEIEIAELKLFSIKNFDDLKAMRRMGDLITIRGGYFWKIGELDNALYYFKFNLEIRLKLKKNLDIAHALNNVGIIYNAKGHLLKALQFLKKSFVMYTKIKYLRGITKTGNNIGAILIQLGKLDESLKYMEFSYQIDCSSNYISGIRVATQNIGEIYWHKKKFKKSLYFLKKGLEIVEKSKKIFDQAEILVPIIAVLLEMNEIDEAKRYLMQMELINKYNNTYLKNKLIYQRFILASALVLKNTKEYSNIEKAEKKLDIILIDKIRYYNITIMALLNYCEILILKYEKSNKITILQKVIKNVEKLIKISEKNNSYSLLAESLVFKAKLSLLDFKFIESKKLLTNAQKIANKFDLENIKYKIIEEKDNLLENLNFWKKSTVKEASFYKKKLLHQINNQLNSFFFNKIKNKKTREIPILFILTKKNGEFITETHLNKDIRLKKDYSEVFYFKFHKNLLNFIENSIDFAIIDEYKVIFTKIGKLIGGYVYIGPSVAAYDKIQLIGKKITGEESWKNTSFKINYNKSLKKIFSN